MILVFADRLRRWGLVFVALALLAAAPVAVDSEPGGLRARIVPCSGSCALMQWDSIQIQGAHANVAVFSVPTSMTQIDSLGVNAIGNIVVIGRLENGISDIEIIDPTKKRSLAEFWTTNFGVSADNRMIAFTEFVAPHLADSIYDGAMVYVLDTANSELPEEGLNYVPSTAIPVFPPYFVIAGRKRVMLLPKSELYLVQSTNFKWLSPDSLMFVATIPKAAHTLRPITLNAPSGDWKNATFEAGQALDCSHREETVGDVDSFLSNCKPAR